MSQQPNYWQQNMNQGGFVNDQNNFPSLGGPPQQVVQQPMQQQPQFYQQQAPQPGFMAPQPGFNQFPAGGQPQFPGFPPPQVPMQMVQPQVAPVAPNPAAAANPFAAAAGANPFSAGAASKAFKPPTEFQPGRKGIMDDEDDAPLFDDFQPGKKKKKKTQAELDEERRKEKEAEDAKLSFKGKPAEFFIMDHQPGNMDDPTGNCRVPTMEQRIFIFTHYPTESQPSAMINKIYMLYQDAYNYEEAERRRKEAYTKPKTTGPKVVMEEQDEVIDLTQESGFGQPVGAKQTKQAMKQRDAQAQNQKIKNQPKKVKTQDERKQQEESKAKKVSAAIKDITVEPDENCVAVDETRTPASFVFIGHVDAGKSTICGNLIYSMGIVDQRTIEKFKKEAKDKGRDSWWLAYVMDSSDEEKAKGKTVEIGRAVIDTPKKQYTIFDAPGHKNYVPNMIMGATLADFGGLVISARRGEFEAGFEQDGQTREHIQLARSLGISKLVIVVNKMDEATVSWKQARWEHIKTNLIPFLEQCGYTTDDLFWVPISGLTGQNIVEPVDSSVCNWYSGPTLLDILDNMPVEQRNADAPLRIPVLDKMKDSNRSIIFGKVEQGTVRLGDRLALAPRNLPCQVLNIVNDKQQQVTYGRPGDNVQLKISYLDEDEIFKGDVLCPRDNPMQSSMVLEAEIELMELQRPIFSKGSQCMMHIHTYADDVNIKDIKWALEKDPNTGEEVKKDMPKFTRSFAKCLVRIGMKNAIPVEKVTDCGALGRFTLRDEGKTIALGRVIRYIPFNKDRQQQAPQQARTAAATTASAASDGAAAVDKVAPIVFNLETGQTEDVPKPLDSIAEDEKDGAE